MAMTAAKSSIQAHAQTHTLACLLHYLIHGVTSHSNNIQIFNCIRGAAVAQLHSSIQELGVIGTEEQDPPVGVTLADGIWFTDQGKAFVADSLTQYI